MKFMSVEGKTMRQRIKNLPGAQTISNVIWAHWLDAAGVSIVTAAKGGVEMGIDRVVVAVEGALQVVMVTVFMVDQQMSINKDMSWTAHESCGPDSTYWCMCH
jgi:hypothetical protein